MKNPALRLLLLPLVAFACLSTPVERWVQKVFEIGEATNIATLEDGETFQIHTLTGGASVRATLAPPDKPEGPEIRLERVGDVVLGPARLVIAGPAAGAFVSGRVMLTTNALAVHLTLEVATNSPAAFVRAR